MVVNLNLEDLVLVETVCSMELHEDLEGLGEALEASIMGDCSMDLGDVHLNQLTLI